MKLRYSYEIIDPLTSRRVEKSKRWLRLSDCRAAAEERAAEILDENGWPCVWVLVRNRDDRVLRHLTVFAGTKNVARNDHLEEGPY